MNLENSIVIPPVSDGGFLISQFQDPASLEAVAANTSPMHHISTKDKYQPIPVGA